MLAVQKAKSILVGIKTRMASRQRKILLLLCPLEMMVIQGWDPQPEEDVDLSSREMRATEMGLKYQRAGTPLL